MATRFPEIRVDPDAWDQAVAGINGPQLVVAGPGAGKTEFLARRTLHLIEQHGVTPEGILLLTFSRRGAADLRARITAQLDRSFTVIPTSTFHSFAFHLLESANAGHAMPTLLTGPEQVALVAQLLADEKPGRWPLPFRPLLTTNTFAEEVADFVLRCQEHLIDPEQLAERAEERADWRGLPGFLKRYRAALIERGRIDYGTLQSTAVTLLEHTETQQRIAGQFHHVLVDEYQDTTPAQARLLQQLYRPHRNLTVAGDPYQSIYSFRGAELGNVAAFPADFPDSEGRPARRLVLTTSFRVPAEILEAAVRVTAGGELPGAAGPVIPAPGRGSVETYGFDQQSHEAEWIASQIQRLRLRDQLPYRRMAVLVRSKRRFLPELSRALERRGVPHDVPDRRLADHPAVRVVLDVARAAAGQDQAATLRRILLGPLFALPLSAVRQFEREHAAGSDDWAQVVRRSVPDGAALADLIAEPAWAVESPAVEGFWHLWSHLPQFVAAVADPARRSDRAAWSSLAQVLARLSERDPEATLADYLRWSEAEDFEATPLLEYAAPDEDRLVLTTLHQAKGVEFDIVFIADAVEGVFPDLRLRESLLGVRHLRHPGDTSSYARFRLQEEMRLAYTAMCRARLRVVWTCTTNSAAEGSGPPSRFLPLAAGVETVAAATLPPTEDAEPATPLDAEAWLRRMVRDPAAAEANRLAALAALVGPGAWRKRPPEVFAGVLEAGPDHGLVPEDVALSPSQADLYLTCPRLYAFRRRLGVDDASSRYARLGTLIHSVLESVEGAALAAGNPHGTLEEALAELSKHWDPHLFEGGEWAEAWRRRAEAVLRHLYENWPSDARVAAVESPLRLEFEDTLWRGRADRIETLGGAVRIVDYKTGTVPYSRDDAAVSVQLGLYVLAAAADPQIAALGTVDAAEFWFPAAPRKSVSIRRLDLGRLPEVEELMRRAACGIRAEDWPPLPGSHCRTCGVRRVCPEWPEGREAYLT
jgi:superfamily I DNA/RNA helicase/RecB family exonuclease